jgi:hypothetical protein
MKLKRQPEVGVLVVTMLISGSIGVIVYLEKEDLRSRSNPMTRLFPSSMIIMKLGVTEELLWIAQADMKRRSNHMTELFPSSMINMKLGITGDFLWLI